MKMRIITFLLVEKKRKYLRNVTTKLFNLFTHSSYSVYVVRNNIERKKLNNNETLGGKSFLFLSWYKTVNVLLH